MTYSNIELEKIAFTYKEKGLEEISKIIYELLHFRHEIKSITDMAAHMGRIFDDKTPWSQQVNQLIVKALQK